MQLIDCLPIVLPVPSQPIYLHNFTDIHMGAEGCDRAQLREDIRELKRRADDGEMHRWFMGGDAINGIGAKDKRHDASAIAEEFKKFSGKSLFQRQARAVVEDFSPIRDMGLFVGSGNHEAKVAKTCDYDPTEHIAEQLDLPHAGYSAGFRLRIHAANDNTKHTVSCFWHHGWGSGRTMGARANLGMRLLEILDADLYFTGHVHTPIYLPDVRLKLSRAGKLRLERRERLIVVGASYLKTYPTTQTPQTNGGYDPERDVQSDYAEQKGYRPTVIGHTGASLRVLRRSVSEGENHYVQLQAVDFR